MMHGMEFVAPPPRIHGLIALGTWLIASCGTGPDTGDDSAPPALPDCASWCEGMHQTCPEEAFHKEGACTTWCEDSVAPVPLGSLADRDLDTLGCRLHWLNEAAGATTESQRLESCANASASGGDTCGSWCEVYCRQGVASCSGANEDYPANQRTWFDEDPNIDPHQACAEACPGFSTEVLQGISQTEQQFGYGDTVQCRLHHQQAAMIEGVEQASNYGLHCGHAAIAPTELCLDTTRPNVVNYCEFALEFCPELFPAGTTAGICRSSLGALVDDGTYDEGPFLSFTDQDRNSLGCLNYWIMRAPLDAEACAKADWDPAHWQTAGGAGVCDTP